MPLSYTPDSWRPAEALLPPIASQYILTVDSGNLAGHLIAVKQAAIDYTPDRLPKNQTQVVIHSFMAHHQGMSLVAIDNVLHDEQQIGSYAKLGE